MRATLRLAQDLGARSGGRALKMVHPGPLGEGHWVDQLTEFSEVSPKVQKKKPLRRAASGFFLVDASVVV